MTDSYDAKDRDRWARLRFAIIGPLLAAPPAKGELQSALRELSRRTWQHPTTGAPIVFGVSTIERWLYAARQAADPVASLKNRPRPKAGHAGLLCEALIGALNTQYFSTRAQGAPHQLQMLWFSWSPHWHRKAPFCCGCSFDTA